MKPKICKWCGAEFTPTISTMQKCCSGPCAASYIREQKDMKEQVKKRREQKRARERIKTRSQWLKEAQEACNAYVRERDLDLPCVSCGRHHQGQYHAGHYRSVGAEPSLRFHARFNIWKQCAPCNNHKSGNPIDYRIELVRRIGLAAVEWLEGPHQPQKWSIEEIKEIKEYYRDLLKQLRAGRG